MKKIYGKVDEVYDLEYKVGRILVDIDNLKSEINMLK